MQPFIADGSRGELSPAACRRPPACVGPNRGTRSLSQPRVTRRPTSPDSVVSETSALLCRLWLSVWLACGSLLRIVLRSAGGGLRRCRRNRVGLHIGCSCHFFGSAFQRQWAIICRWSAHGDATTLLQPQSTLFDRSIQMDALIRSLAICWGKALRYLQRHVAHQAFNLKATSAPIPLATATNP